LISRHAVTPMHSGKKIKTNYVVVKVSLKICFKFLKELSEC
jgi:hypothetical protein